MLSHFSFSIREKHRCFLLLIEQVPADRTFVSGDKAALPIYVVSSLERLLLICGKHYQATIMIYACFFNLAFNPFTAGCPVLSIKYNTVIAVAAAVYLWLVFWAAVFSVCSDKQ